MGMRPHATVKPWRKTIRGERREDAHNRDRRRTRAITLSVPVRWEP